MFGGYKEKPYLCTRKCSETIFRCLLLLLAANVVTFVWRLFFVPLPNGPADIIFSLTVIIYIQLIHA